MTYFERYKSGQRAAVWDELAALGEAVRDPAILADAMSVAHLTMERVATNIERLVNSGRASLSWSARLGPFRCR